jgi:Protein of unknown function (DUF3175)
MATKRVRRWSRRVTQTSDALDLEKGLFAGSSPRGIARSLKRSADRSRRRKSDPFRSAMSMLNFYINRAGRNLSKTRLRRLHAAKDELRVLYGRARGSTGRGARQHLRVSHRGRRASKPRP